MAKKPQDDRSSASWADRIIEENLRSVRESEERFSRTWDTLRRRVQAWALDSADSEPNPPWRLRVKAFLKGLSGRDDAFVELGVLQWDPSRAAPDDPFRDEEMGPLLVLTGYAWDRTTGVFRLDELYVQPLVSNPTLTDALKSVWEWIDQERSRRGLFLNDLRFVGGSPTWVKALKLRRRLELEHEMQAFLESDGRFA